MHATLFLGLLQSQRFPDPCEAHIADPASGARHALNCTVEAAASVILDFDAAFDEGLAVQGGVPFVIGVRVRNPFETGPARNWTLLTCERRYGAGI